MTVPLVSVLVPLFNGANFIRRSLDSILSQSFGDFEVVVVDDGSTDAGPGIVSAITDPRIRLVRQENQGLASALNHAIRLSRGHYLARQDHDDLSLPRRFEKQIAFLQSHPEVALLGTRAEIWVRDRATDRYFDPPCDDAALRFELLFNNPFVHSSIMMRADAVREVGGYGSDPAQDYDLWSRLARHHRIANLEERLVIYREVQESISRSSDPGRRLERVVSICASNLSLATGQVAGSPVATTVAALHHGAIHMCLRSVELRQMRALVKASAAPIIADAHDSDVSVRCQRILRAQLYKWLRYRHRWLAPLFRAVPGFVVARLR